jgi:hypothetical protein
MLENRLRSGRWRATVGLDLPQLLHDLDKAPDAIVIFIDALLCERKESFNAICRPRSGSGIRTQASYGPVKHDSLAISTSR